MIPTISVIIPAHNEEQYIEKTLDSLERQTLQDFETIVVSNGCTDKTPQIVASKAMVHHYILNQANVSMARNYGAKVATGELLVFVDADTHLLPDCLSTIVHQFSPTDTVATTLSKPDTDLLRYNLALHFKNTYTRAHFYHGCSGVLICRRADFFKVGGYPHLKVREHRKLILKLQKLGKFKCIDSYTTTSMRRFQKWGLTKATLFWMQQWLKDQVGSLEESEYEKIR